MKEREISLIDLIVEILLKWRVIVVWMLVGGILMGCLSYVRSYQTAQSQRTQTAVLEQRLQQAESVGQVELEYLQSGLTDIQVHNVNAAVNYENLWKSEEAYLQESIKMQMDPLNVPRALLTFQVVAEDIETAQRIEQVYEDMVPDGLGQWLSERTQEGTSAALSELISLDRKSGKLSAGNAASRVGENDIIVYNIFEEKSDTFRVVICHVSEEQCLQLAEKVNEYFQEQNLQLVRKMGAHQIQLVNQSFSFVMDEVLLCSQQEVQSSIAKWRVSAAKLEDAFSVGEWQYYNYLTTGKQQENSVGEQQSGEDEAQNVLPLNVVQPSVSIKYVLIGMILFAFIYALYVFLKYILYERLRATDDIAFIYGVPELGVIPEEKGGKKLLAVVDDWILKLRDWNKRRFAMEEAMGLAAVAVKMAAKKEGLNEICCIGCNLKTNAVKTADIIQNVLKDADISMKVLNNALYDQEAMEQLLSAQGAFLLERAGETLYDEISREIELLHRQEIKVLGIIVVE